MSQAGSRPEDLEGGNVRDNGLDRQSTRDSDQSSQGEPNFGDSSGQLFLMYSKAAEEEDNKMAESWQKDADGMLIFAGLFCASVAVFLSVTVQDLKPNGQDISAFYLGNIYEVLADPNVTRASIPSPVAKPPPFSPPRYAIWVNSLWFLSFVLSLICALLATSLQQWARRYIRVTQPARCSPEKRARMRAFFVHGVDKFHARLVVERLPMLLHLSLFLFLAGLAIHLFNTNHAVFSSVVWSIVLFTTVYGLVTLMPIFQLDSPYFTPLSDAVFRVVHLELAISTVPLAVSVSDMVSPETREHFLRWLDRRFNWAFGGVEKGAEEVVSERSWEVDLRILRWSIEALGDDDTLEKFFEAIPGFFNSKLVRHLEGDFPKYLLNWFWNALNGFLCRTLSSNLVAQSVKSRRLDIGMNAMSVISSSCTSSTSSFSCDIIVRGWYQVPQIAEMGPGQFQVLTHCTSDHEHTAHYAQCIVAKILASVPERDSRWIRFATDAFGLSEQDLRDYIAHGNDSLSLAISIHLIRQSIRSRFYDWDALKAFSNLDIRNTLPELQRDFCGLWNEVVQEASNQMPNSPPVMILRWSRFHYIALHQDTDAVPTEFSLATDRFDPVLLRPSSYPLCNIPSHLPHSTTHAPSIPDSPSFSILSLPTTTSDPPDGSPRQPLPGGSIVLRQAEEVDLVTGQPSPSDPTTANEMREAPENPAAISLASLINSGPRLRLAFPPAAGVHNDNRDQNRIVPMEVSGHRTQSLRPEPLP